MSEFGRTQVVRRVRSVRTLSEGRLGRGRLCTSSCAGNWAAHRQIVSINYALIYFCSFLQAIAVICPLLQIRWYLFQTGIAKIGEGEGWVQASACAFARQ